MGLSHIGEDGMARMVDVTAKESTLRIARAKGFVGLSEATLETVKRGEGPKGEILNTAKLAGIMGTKKTHELVPLCHPLSITHVDVQFRIDEGARRIEILSEVKAKAETGVEMEAMTCVLITALTIYDMLKGVDKEIELGPFYLVEKEGGKSGRYVRGRP